MQGIGLSVPPSATAHSLDEAMAVVERIGLPVVIRPAFILGGKGTGIAATPDEFDRLAATGLAASPISEILIERSIAGWKEYELEVMRDRADNCVVICSIENLDPMGVHTGDSITVAPAQTLTDVEYQAMRDAAFACIRRVGVETGGSNVQFALDPTNGDMVIIEMNPRVSRSSALASKATGFPIAKIAAKLAVGYTLDEIPNDITRKTPASFEPTIDYVVTKVPRWAFEKFPGSPGVLGTSMQSVGEGWPSAGPSPSRCRRRCAASSTAGRASTATRPRPRSTTWTTTSWSPGPPSAPPTGPFQLEAALRRGITVDDLAEPPGSTRGSSTRCCASSRSAAHLAEVGLDGMGRRDWKRAKQLGFSDAQLGLAVGEPTRPPCGPPGWPPACGPRSRPSTPAAPSSRPSTPYHYSTYEDEDEVRPQRAPQGADPRVGAQPHRPGHRVRLLLRPRQLRPGRRRLRDRDAQLQPRDRLDRLRHLRPAVLRAAHAGGRPQRHRGRAGRRRAGGRGRGPRRPDPAEAGGVAARGPGAGHVAGLDRPGRGPRAVERPVRPPGDPPAGGRHRHHAWTRPWPSSSASATRPCCGPATCSAAGPWRSSTTTRACAGPWPSWPASAASAGRAGCPPPRPVLIDRFLEDATEVDVDALRDHTGEVVIGGVMEHVEEAGVHSGDSACSIPPYSLSAERPWR